MAAQGQVPVAVYPTTMTTQSPPSSPHSDGGGSFGTVFIVLAVIIVISAIACFLGRLCNRRLNKQKPSKQSHHHGQNVPNGGGFRPHKEGDVELGFEKMRMPVMPPHGKPGGGNGDFRGFRMPGHGDFRGEAKINPADEGEMRGNPHGGDYGEDRRPQAGFVIRNRE